MKHTAAHPGFEGASEAISTKEHIPMARAKAILAASAHKSSKKAQEANPRLLKVSGTKKKY